MTPVKPNYPSHATCGLCGKTITVLKSGVLRSHNERRGPHTPPYGIRCEGSTPIFESTGIWPVIVHITKKAQT